VIHEINWITEALTSILTIRGEIKFAVVSSLSPFQVSRLDHDRFVILVDQRAFYFLLTLCLRLQSLHPLADLFRLTAIPETRNYCGRYLLDITKDIVFHSDDISHLLTKNAAGFIHQAALTYIIGHEIAHIAHGHLEFRASGDFSKFACSDEDKNLTLRTLEMDADSSATTSVFDVFERVIAYKISAGMLPEDPPASEFKLNVRRQYTSGMFIAVLYLDTLTTNYMPSAHPIGYARFLTTARVLELIFSSHQPEAVGVPEDMRQALVQTFAGLSGDLRNLGHPIASNVMIYEEDARDPTHAYHPIGIASGLSHLDPLYGRWARLRPYLEKYLRGGRLAPAARPPH
jgi:hypothetical protein